jgi:hypothetical protein
MLAYCDMTSIRNVFLCQCTQNKNMKRERKMKTLKNARAIAIKHDKCVKVNLQVKLLLIVL